MLRVATARRCLRLVGVLLALRSTIPMATAADRDASLPRFVDRFCVGCHDDGEKAGGLDLSALVRSEVGASPEAWEKVVRQVGARLMPPLDAVQPAARERDAVVGDLIAVLDRRAAEQPDPGRAATFRRLTRAEYQNAVRDLLAVDVVAADLLPPDESSHGFDNITVADLSPTFVDRAVTAAGRIARLAVGNAGKSPDGATYRVAADVTQEDHVAGLPLGTRGGTIVAHTFPRDGTYEITVRLARDRNEQVEGLREPADLEILVDREPRATLAIAPPRRDSDHQTADAHLKVRLDVAAGPHAVGVTFRKQPASLLDTKREPTRARFNMHRHPRTAPAVYQVSITGPHADHGPGDTPSRRRLFAPLVSAPRDADEEARARLVLAPLLRRAYRRPVADEDWETPLRFFRDGRAEGGFDAGIEAAVAAVLVNPQFLLRIEAEPSAGVAKAGTAYPLPDVALASRLSFFLWSSIPDDALLDCAERGELNRPDELARQVRRMLADPRAASLATLFAGQWLHLRNLDSTTPDLRLFPDFDDNLRQAMRTETEMPFAEVARLDRPVTDLLRADHAFLNERLARHYGIPHVVGSEFRRVALGPDSHRGGLLRHGSVLTVTSYATRTAPTIRGKWVLENLLGTPPPPPPPNIPSLGDQTVSASFSIRDRLAEHRRNESCAGCHNRMDPVGFALEGYDAVGRWRDREDGTAIDTAGALPDGRPAAGVSGLEQGLLDRPERFVATVAEKLLTYALGRVVEPADAPAVRAIVREARADGDRFSAVVVGVATSVPFRMGRRP